MASEFRFTELPDREKWTWGRLAALAVCGIRNRWARAFGRGKAFDEGRDTALSNAAMVAYDMGRPDIRHAINRLIPLDSPYRPADSIPEPAAAPTPGGPLTPHDEKEVSRGK